MNKKSVSLSASTNLAIALLVIMFSGQAMAQSQKKLSPGDYIEIQQLVNKLSFALDYCTNGGKDFADLFVAGGEFIIDQGDGKPSVRSTRDQLIALAWGPDCKARATPPSSYILHLSASLVIEPTAEGARGLSYALYPASKGHYLNAETAGQLGINHDVYIKTAQGWRFQSRRHETNPVAGEVKL